MAYGRYSNLSLNQLQKGHRYDFVMPEMQNGQEVMEEHINYKFDKIEDGEAHFQEPNKWASHEDEDDIMWSFTIPLDIAQRLTYNVSSEGDTDKESQEGGKRKSGRRRTAKSGRKRTRKSGRRRTRKSGRRRTKRRHKK